MSTLSEWIIRLTSIVLVYACSLNKDGTHVPVSTVKFIEIKGNGDITSKLTVFREILGDHLNTTPDQTKGRREINWDDVPANQTNVNSFRGDFFNSLDPAEVAGRKHGAVLTTTGTGLRVSDNGFSDLMTSGNDRFNTLSAGRTFAAVGSNTIDVTFCIPGKKTPASVQGFGAIFSDVDNASSTTLEFFEGDKSLGTFKAPTRIDSNGLSFLGVKFPENHVSRVRITVGNAPISKIYTDGLQHDLVVMDDFLYDEPQAD